MARVAHSVLWPMPYTRVRRRLLNAEASSNKDTSVDSFPPLAGVFSAWLLQADPTTQAENIQYLMTKVFLEFKLVVVWQAHIY